MEKVIDSVRAREDARDVGEKRAQQEQWDGYLDLSGGFDFLLSRIEHSLRSFYAKTPTHKDIARYDQLIRTLRVAAELFKRDAEVQSLPSYAELETLDVQVQELQRIVKEIHGIDGRTPTWDDRSWRSEPMRAKSIERERQLEERFSCTANEIAYSDDEIMDDTKVYDGPIKRGLLQRLKHVPHVFFESTNHEIERMSVPLGEYHLIDEYREVFSKLGVQLDLGKWERFSVKTGNGALAVVRISSAALDVPGASRQDMNSKAMDMGLRACTEGEALALALALAQSATATNVKLSVEIPFHATEIGPFVGNSGTLTDYFNGKLIVTQTDEFGRTTGNAAPAWYVVPE